MRHNIDTNSFNFKHKPFLISLLIGLFLFLLGTMITIYSVSRVPYCPDCDKDQRIQLICKNIDSILELGTDCSLEHIKEIRKLKFNHKTTYENN